MTAGLPPGLGPAIEASLGVAVVGAAALGGGDNARSFRLALADGRTVFAKTQPGAPAHTLSTEAAGLRWLAAGAPPSLGVPEVLAVHDGDPGAGVPNLLVLGWIEVGGRRTSSGEAELGAGLARLHAAGAPAFGRDDRRPTGSRGLPNDPCPGWAEFYASRRLLPLARLAADAEALAPDAVRGLEHVAHRLAELGGPPEPPARLHGDLWAGNRIVGRDGRNWLVDPAAHGGHREFDLAMTDLFGGFGPEVRAAYHEAAPLADGWEDRVALHQLAPLVVHAIKFGGGYRAAATHAIDQYR